MDLNQNGEAMMGTIDYRHSANTVRILTGELQNGDLNWREGHLFLVTNLRRIPQTDGPDVIRFDGVIVENHGETDDLKGTGYDTVEGHYPAVYGAHAEVPTTIVKRELL